MGTILAFLAVAVAGFVVLGGLALTFAKIFNIPLFGDLLLPVKLLFIAVLGFCLAYTANGLAARFVGFDLQDRLEKLIDRVEDRRD